MTPCLTLNDPWKTLTLTPTLTLNDPRRHAYRIVAFNTVIEFGTAVYRNAVDTISFIRCIVLWSENELSPNPAPDLAGFETVIKSGTTMLQTKASNSRLGKKSQSARATAGQEMTWLGRTKRLSAEAMITYLLTTGTIERINWEFMISRSKIRNRIFIKIRYWWYCIVYKDHTGKSSTSYC